jgi:hypothetical protein
LISYQTDDNRCDCCKKQGRKKCYHIEVCDSMRTELLLHDLESLVGEYYEMYKKEFHLVQKDIKLMTDLTQAIGKSIFITLIT